MLNNGNFVHTSRRANTARSFKRKIFGMRTRARHVYSWLMALSVSSLAKIYKYRYISPDTFLLRFFFFLFFFEKSYRNAFYVEHTPPPPWNCAVFFLYREAKCRSKEEWRLFHLYLPWSSLYRIPANLCQIYAEVSRGERVLGADGKIYFEFTERFATRETVINSVTHVAQVYFLSVCWLLGNRLRIPLT